MYFVKDGTSVRKTRSIVPYDIVTTKQVISESF